MKYLLDTHVFIWLDNNPERLSEKAAAICTDPNNLLLLSMASVWEMQIKVQLGKLRLPAPLIEIVHNQVTSNRVQLLPIELSHVLGLSALPDHHKDPFDRLLIAQTMVEGASLLTDDSKVTKYLISTVW